MKLLRDIVLAFLAVVLGVTSIIPLTFAFVAYERGSIDLVFIFIVIGLALAGTAEEIYPFKTQV